MKTIHHHFLLLLFVLLVLCQQAIGQRVMEELGRGLVAVKVNNGVYVNWRITGQEWYDVSYNLYRDGNKLNENPITGASNYTDKDGALNSKYQVSAIIKGIEQDKCEFVGVLPHPYIEIEMAPIPKIDGVPDKCYEDYSINDITIADLDGDGEYELIVKRVNLYLGDWGADRHTNKYYTLFDAYKMHRNANGLPEWELMWRIDVGPNIYNDVEINCLAFDLDGDGKAEVVMRTSEGTVDAAGKIFGPSSNFNSVHTSKENVKSYREQIMTPGIGFYESAGPEYLSLFDGETGVELDRKPHIAREPFAQWGHWGFSAGVEAGLAHRATKFFYGAPYLDGKKPSLFVSRGIYHRIKMQTYDIVDKKLVPRWSWDCDQEKGGNYYSQGNHNFTIADIDGDGCDEIVYGQMTVNHDGKGLYTTELGHGDAIHVGDFDPYRKGLEIFNCLESPVIGGTTLRAGESAEILSQWIAGRDIGRCMAANFSNEYRGAACWPSIDGGVYSAGERKKIPLPGAAQNFRIYWDGDLLEEIVDHHWNGNTRKGKGVIAKYRNGGWSDLLISDYYSCNDTKGTPCLQADLFGDWREEVIWRSDDDTKIRIHFTTYPTEHRIYTLMHDMQYRQAIAWQMCGYNQPPHVSFFLGELENRLTPPPPVMDNQFLVFQPNASTWTSSSSNWIKDGSVANFADGEKVLFDVSGHTSNPIQLQSTVAPSLMKVNSLNDYEFDMSNGKLSGDMRLIKQGAGKLTFNGNHDFTGDFDIWDGEVSFNGSLNSSVNAGFFTHVGIAGSITKDLTMRYDASLYPGQKDKAGTLIIEGNLSLEEKNAIVFDLDASTAKHDKIIITQDFNTGKDLSLIFKSKGVFAAGDYELIRIDGNSDFNLSNVQIVGLESYPYMLSFQDNRLVLTIKAVRSAGNNVYWQGSPTSSVWDFGFAENFLKDSSLTYFVNGDAVIFNDEATRGDISIAKEVRPNSIGVNSSKDFTFSGDGIISGSTSLTKSGSGTLTLDGMHAFTGQVFIRGGNLVTNSLSNKGESSGVGAGSEIVFDNGQLDYAGVSVETNKDFVLQGDGSLSVSSVGRTLSHHGVVSGSGKLIKEGRGELSLSGTNTFSGGLVIREGILSMANEQANLTALSADTLWLEGGSLRFFDVNKPQTIRKVLHVSSDKTTNLYSGSRTNLHGSIEGTGTLGYYSLGTNNYISADLSQFEGTLNVRSVSTDGGSRLMLNHASGVPNGSIYLNSNVTMMYYSSADITIPIGDLSGATNSELGAGGTLRKSIVWEVGGLNLNSTFRGVISNAQRSGTTATTAIKKVGSGVWTLTNNNTYTGGTSIQDGSLLVNNSSGSGLGTGDVVVESGGTLSGKGIITAPVTVNSGGVLSPGDGIGTLSLSHAVVSSGGILSIEINKSTQKHDLLRVTDGLSMNGALQITASGSADFSLGDSFTIVEGTISGAPERVFPSPGLGLGWDLSEFHQGKIKVGVSSGLDDPVSSSMHIYPTVCRDNITIYLKQSYPQVHVIIYSMQGEKIREFQYAHQSQIDVDVRSLPEGMYLVHVLHTDGGYMVDKIIKK